MTLDISPFEKSIARLHEGLECYNREVSDTQLRIQLRDGLIQRFEFTYELSHKTLKRYLEFTSPNPERYDTVSFQDLIREGNEQGLLLHDWPSWKSYREMRSRSSHTYDEDMARQVVDGIPQFLEEVRYLVRQLAKRSA